jgi:hypothetical protein
MFECARSLGREGGTVIVRCFGDAAGTRRIFYETRILREADRLKLKGGMDRLDKKSNIF